MPRIANDDDWDDEPDSDADDEGEGDDYTTPCPYCKRPIHEDAERCPYCERYISQEDMPAKRKPWWIIAGTLICLYLIYRWVAG